MKKLSVILSLVAIVAVSSTSFGLVRVVTTCQTSDNLYRVMVLANEGIGPVRTAALSAVCYNANNEVIANFPISTNAGEMKSASFGRTMYFDTASHGNRVMLAFVSTNYRNTTLKAVMQNGSTLSEMDPVCR